MPFSIPSIDLISAQQRRHFLDDRPPVTGIFTRWDGGNTAFSEQQSMAIPRVLSTIGRHLVQTATQWIK